MYFYTLNVMKLRKYLLSEVFYAATLLVILQIFQFKLCVFELLRNKKYETVLHFLLRSPYLCIII